LKTITTGWETKMKNLNFSMPSASFSMNLGLCKKGVRVGSGKLKPLKQFKSSNG